MLDRARHVVHPNGIATTGWPKVRDTCAELGWHFDDWQEGFLRLVLAKDRHGLYAADTVALSVPRQSGKALDLDTDILTANCGWTTMRDIAVGDQVYGADGHPTRVDYVSPVWTGNDCYRVTMTDGRSVVADADHLWQVDDRRTERSRVLTTAELITAGIYRDTRGRERRFRIPKLAPLRTPETNLPVDPYILGAWLGNGTRGSGAISCGVGDTDHYVKAVEDAGYLARIRHDRTCDTVTPSGEGSHWRARTLKAQLVELGICDVKWVPEQYLTAAPQQRARLLQGLCDTDGSVDKKGRVEFCSTTKDLADAVMFLVRSLGWRAQITESEARLNGRYISQRWRVTFTPHTDDEFAAFTLPRKADRLRDSTGSRGGDAVSIDTIEPVPTRPTRCIRVDNDDHLFVAGRDLVVTHNTFVLAATSFALCLLEPDLTVAWSSHRFRTARESYDAMRSLARDERVLPHIEHVDSTRGEEAIRFVNGSRILFGARERGFGRGFARIGMLVFDEAQILSESALDDMIPATNAHPNPLIMMAGTPPKPTDPGEVFTQIREEAIDGTSPNTLYVEFSADRGADPEDTGQWLKANPSYPHRTGARAIERMRKSLSPGSFTREGLGVWDERSLHRAVVGSTDWQKLVDPGPDLDVPPTGIGLDQSHDGVLAVAACWQATDTQAHLDLLQVGQMVDLHGVASWIAGLAGHKIPVYVDSYSPASPLIPLLKAQKVKVKATTATDMANACGMFLSDATAPWEDPEDRRLTHSGTAHLDGALQGATKRKIGDAGGWGWDRRNTESLISPLVAATLARLAAAQRRTRSGAGRAEQGRRSSDGRRSGGTRRALVT